MIFVGVSDELRTMGHWTIQSGLDNDGVCVLDIPCESPSVITPSFKYASYFTLILKPAAEIDRVEWLR